MQEAGASVPMFGLAKRFEEIYLPGREDPIVLDRRSNALHLVQYVRDEAHASAHAPTARCAARGPQERAFRHTRCSPKKQAALIRHFRSVKAIFEATQEELCPGGGPSVPDWRSVFTTMRRSAANPPPGRRNKKPCLGGPEPSELPFPMPGASGKSSIWRRNPALGQGRGSSGPRRPVRLIWRP